MSLKSFMASKLTNTPDSSVCSMVKSDTFDISSEEDVKIFCNHINRILKGKTPEHKYAFNIKGKNKEKRFCRARFDIDLSRPVEDKFLTGLIPEKDANVIFAKQYTMKDVEQIRKILIDTIANIILDIKGENLTVALLEKEPYINNEKKVVKNGFHLEFPNLFLRNGDLAYITHIVNDTIVEQNIFPEFQPDNCFVNNRWLMYGGSKPGRIETYKVSTFFDKAGKIIPIEDMAKDYIRMFWMFPVSEADKKLCKHRILDEIPSFLLIDEEVEENEEEIEGKIDSEEVVEHIEWLLSGLSQKRVEERISWGQILLAIKSYCNTAKVEESIIFTLCDEWSQKTTKNNYDMDAVKRVLERGDTKGFFGLHTLVKYWKADNFTHQLILNWDDTNLARLISMKFKKNIVVNTKEGFIFNEQTMLWNYKPVNYIEIFHYVAPWLEEQFRLSIQICNKNPNISPEEKVIIVEQIKNIKKGEKYIKTDRNKSGIIRGVARFLPSDSEFQMKLNTVKNLIPIQGEKVIDVLTGKIRVRKIDDYFTYEVNVDYLSENTCDNAKKYFLSLSNGNNELALYITQLTGYFLSSETFDRCFYQLTGIGKNGKSTYEQILAKLNGENYVNIPKTMILYDSKHPNKDETAPNPFLCQMEGKRVATYNETMPYDLIHSGRMKGLTGGDIIKARDLYAKKDDIRSFYNTAKQIIISNHIVENHDNDQALKDRTRIITFSNRYEGTEEEKDYINNLMNNTHGLLSEIFTLSIREFIKVSKCKNISPPQCVVEENKAFFEEMDVVGCFISECCEIGNFNVPSSSLYSEFIFFCNQRGVKAQSDRFFCKEMRMKSYPKKVIKIDKKATNAFLGLRLIK